MRVGELKEDALLIVRFWLHESVDEPTELGVESGEGDVDA